MAKKIKFTSKKNPKPSKLARAGGDVQTSSIYYQGERIGSVEGNTRIILICDPKPVCFETKRTPRPQVCSKLCQGTRSMDMGQLQSSNQITT